MSIKFKPLSNELQSISPCSVTGLFGITPESSHLTNAQSDSIAFLTLVVRRLILMELKDSKPPTFTHWIKDALYFLKLESIRYSLKGSANKYNKIWGPSLDYVMEQITLPDFICGYVWKFRNVWDSGHSFSFVCNYTFLFFFIYFLFLLYQCLLVVSIHSI